MSGDDVNFVFGSLRIEAMQACLYDVTQPGCLSAATSDHVHQRIDLLPPKHAVTAKKERQICGCQVASVEDHEIALGLVP